MAPSTSTPRYRKMMENSFSQIASTKEINKLRSALIYEVLGGLAKSWEASYDCVTRVSRKQLKFRK